MMANHAKWRVYTWLQLVVLSKAKAGSGIGPESDQLKRRRLGWRARAKWRARRRMFKLFLSLIVRGM